MKNQDDTIYYGLADCFLLDNAYGDGTLLRVNNLISHESDTVESLIEKCKATDTVFIKKNMKLFKQVKISDMLASKYLVKYKKVPPHIEILEKTKFNSEHLEKYLILL